MSTLAAALLMASNYSLAAQPQSPHWVGSWAAAPQANGASAGSKETVVRVNNQTIRQIVHTSIGGYKFRVRLSNALGKTPLVIGEARVALSAGKNTINPDTDRPLTFGGISSTTIPPGAVMYSDPVDMRFSSQADLAISLYLPEQTEAKTVHTLGKQTNYISTSGNHTKARALQTKSTSTSWYFLTGVDILTHKDTTAVVAFGDSITDGLNAAVDTNNRWTDYLARRLLNRSDINTKGVLNLGISGNRILHEQVGPSALSRFDRDVIAQPGVTHLILLEGINDIGYSDLPGSREKVSAKQIIAGYKQLIARAKTHGLKVIGATLLPYEGGSYYTRQGEAKRQEVNKWIRESGAYDAVIDFDKTMRDPKRPIRLNPLFDSGDHIHPNETGFLAMANAVNLDWLK
ncbi:SGNH/GDSL hydrolase family protein [Pseudomonas luteola]|uniref:SGNH/GDSL hydrolase family protein n=1 Tax=Pseudomonas luteola TaxID=47886 RepID=A0ABS0MWW4_PSELU|nr:SGNH/GDSL hydrolase family protein [Pseudomonas luteola]MBH3441189.1 SGNH/GDSL hydrolase family protein [Pseudomonas luteola]